MARKKTPPTAPLDLARSALECPSWFPLMLQVMRGEEVFVDSPKILAARRAAADEFDAWEEQRIATIGVLDELIARRAAETQTTK
jgi:hypothetical protein